MFRYRDKDFKSKAELRDWLNKQPLLLKGCRFILCDEFITCSNADTYHVNHVKYELIKRIISKNERYVYGGAEFKTREDLILHLKHQAVVRKGILYVGCMERNLTEDYNVNIYLLIEELAQKVVDRSCYLS